MTWRWQQERSPWHVAESLESLLRTAFEIEIWPRSSLAWHQSCNIRHHLEIETLYYFPWQAYQVKCKRLRPNVHVGIAPRGDAVPE